MKNRTLKVRSGYYDHTIKGKSCCHVPSPVPFVLIRSAVQGRQIDTLASHFLPSHLMAPIQTSTLEQRYHRAYSKHQCLRYNH